jgi:hypothetical protein
MGIRSVRVIFVGLFIGLMIFLVGDVGAQEVPGLSGTDRVAGWPTSEGSAAGGRYSPL